MAVNSPRPSSPIDDLERSMRQLERDFSLRDPYQSGMVSRSEFTFVLVRNGGMLTQIDALADRFQVPISSVTAASGVRSQPATVDYIKFLKHMRQLAAGVDDDRPRVESPATRRSLHGELGGTGEVQPPARQPPPLPPPAAGLLSPPPVEPSPSTRQATFTERQAIAVGRDLPGVRDAASPIGLPVSTIGGITCYDWMETVATRTSASRSPPQPKPLGVVPATSVPSPSLAPMASTVHRESGRRERQSLERTDEVWPQAPAQESIHRVDPAGTATAQQRSSSSPAEEDSNREAVVGGAPARNTSGGSKISLREVFHIIRVGASLLQSPSSTAPSSSTTTVNTSKAARASISLADIVTALERQRIAGVSLPQLEALCDSLGFSETSVNMEEFCLLVARLPPLLIESLRTRATWQTTVKLPFNSSSLGAGVPDPSIAPSVAIRSDCTASVTKPAAADDQPPRTASPATLASPPPPSTPPVVAESSVVAAVAFPVLTDSGPATDSRNISRMLHFPTDGHEVPREPKEQASSAEAAEIPSRTPLSSTMQQKLPMHSAGKSSPRTGSGTSGYAARESATTSRRVAAATASETASVPATPLPSSRAAHDDGMVQSTTTANIHAQRSQHPPRGGATQRFQQATKSSSNKLQRGARHPEPIATEPPKSSAASSRRSTPRASPATSRTSSKHASTASSRTSSPGVRVERLSLTSSAASVRFSYPAAAAQRRNHADPRSHAPEQKPLADHHPSSQFDMSSPTPAAPWSSRGSDRGSGPNDALVRALSGRCADLMSMCTSVDRHRVGKLPLASLTSILHSLAPRLDPVLLPEYLMPYLAFVDGTEHGARSPWFDYVQLVGDLIVAATPPPPMGQWSAQERDRHSDLGQPASPPTHRSSADGNSPTPQPRHALTLRAVNPSHRHRDKDLHGTTATTEQRPSQHPWWLDANAGRQQQQQQQSAIDGARPRSSASRSPLRCVDGPPGIQMLEPRASPQRRSLSRSPSASGGPGALRGSAIEEASLSLEERVRLGRERLKKLLKHELISAAEYQVELLIRCFTAADPLRSGYLAEGEFRRSLLGLFQRASRDMPPWAMDRAVKIAKHPFAALHPTGDRVSDAPSPDAAAVAAARRWTAARGGHSDWCDYEFLLGELGLRLR